MAIFMGDTPLHAICLCCIRDTGCHQERDVKDIPASVGKITEEMAFEAFSCPGHATTDAFVFNVMPAEWDPPQQNCFLYDKG